MWLPDRLEERHRDNLRTGEAAEDPGHLGTGAVGEQNDRCDDVRRGFGQDRGEGGQRRLRGRSFSGSGKAQQEPRAPPPAEAQRVLQLQEQVGPEGRAQGPRQELLPHVMSREQHGPEDGLVTCIQSQIDVFTRAMALMKYRSWLNCVPLVIVCCS